MKERLFLAPPSLDRKSTRLNSSHTVIYTLSLHDALPTFEGRINEIESKLSQAQVIDITSIPNEGKIIFGATVTRSEEHTSELQSHSDLHSFPTRRSSDLRRPHQRNRK